MSQDQASQSKIKFVLFIVLLLSLGLRIFVASDNYLHEWDEKYHALVAKNLITDPLKPMLYKNPVLKYSVDNWVANHVWLDKGPVPLWIMAGSIYFIGENEFAVRFPSLIISVLAVWITFLMGRELFNEKTGLMAAGFHAINGLLIEVAGGRVSSDHIETFFIFFIQFSVFLIIFSVKNKQVNVLSFFIGISTGLAFLCKWTPSLIVFPLWIIAEYCFANKSLGKIFLSISFGILSFIITISPWLIYINVQFPEEANYIFKKFLFAYENTLEQHNGPIYYYFQNLGMVYGELIWIPIIWSLYVLRKMKFDWRLMLLNSWWVIPFIVFSLAATKRHTYLLLSAPALFILLSYFITEMFQSEYKNKVVLQVALFLIIFLPVRYCFERVKPFKARAKEPEWKTELIKLRENYDKKTVFMNFEHSIEGMFYTDYIFYNRLPYEGELEFLTSKGYKVIIKNNKPH